jgi:parallel beta-helix repeat protein
LHKIVKISFAIVCVILVLSAVIYTAFNLQTVNSNSNPGIPTTPEEYEEDEELTPSESPSSPHQVAIVVPDNYTTIQQAVYHASEGGTIFVRKGQYNESVTVAKSLLLIGENKESTKIVANGESPTLMIRSDNVNVTGFSIVNTPTPGSDGPWWMPDCVWPKWSPNIELRNASHCNIYGNSLGGSSLGFLLEGSSQNSIVDNTVSSGVNLQSSSGNYIANNIIHGGDGIRIEFSTNNIVFNNTVTDSVLGIYLSFASGNIFRDNKLVDVVINFGVTGDKLSDYVNEVDASNTIDGKPIYYWISKSYDIVPSDAACIILVDCNDITVQDVSLALGYKEIVFANTNNSKITSSKLESMDPADESDFGKRELEILFFKSFGNTIENNRANIWLNFSSNNRVTRNTGFICLDESNSNEISENTITEISFNSNRYGLILRNSCSNEVKENRITGNDIGIYLSGSPADHNLIIKNTIEGNSHGGIYVVGSEGAKPSHNVIFCNTITENNVVGIGESGQCTSIIGNTINTYKVVGLEIADSTNCSVIGNVIAGFSLGGVDARVIGNNFTFNRVFPQVEVKYTATATFHHNNFLGPFSVSAEIKRYANYVWDDGTQGNYWSGYNGTDSNGDGIGDTPYTIIMMNPEIYNSEFYDPEVNGAPICDSYPLMEPFDISTLIPETPK